jgi:hypothetical protein
VSKLAERHFHGIGVLAGGKFLVDQIKNKDRNDSRDYHFHFDRQSRTSNSEESIKALRLRRQGDFP